MKRSQLESASRTELVVPAPVGGRKRARWKRAVVASVLSGALASVVAVRSASAGFLINGDSVVISTASRMAQGYLGFVRSGAGTGTTQRIGCYTLTYGSGLEGICTATNSAGTTRSCTISALDEAGTDRDKALFDVIAALSGDSFLRFTWDANNKCTVVKIGNVSSLFPKSP